MIDKYHKHSKRAMFLSFSIFGIIIASAFWRVRPSFPMALEPFLVAIMPGAAVVVYLAFGLSQFYEVKALGRSTVLAILLIPMGVFGFAITKYLTDRTETLAYIKEDEPNHDVLDCPSCGMSYRLSDYREDIMETICSGCKNVLKRELES